MFSIFVSFDLIIKIFNLFMILTMFLMVMNNNNLKWESHKKILKIAFIFNEIKINSKSLTKINTFMIFSLFLLIFFFNFLGMIPYYFTFTSQLNICFMLSIMFWTAIFLWNMTYNSKKFITHLVPQGSPTILSQFMVIIELISMMIRPLTLGVRLMANLTAGHLILILCSSPFVVWGLIDMPLFLLILLELMVAVIQAYVFTTLVSMYIGEK